MKKKKCLQAETEDRKIAETIRNMGCGDCCALYFCGK